MHLILGLTTFKMIFHSGDGIGCYITGARRALYECTTLRGAVLDECITSHYIMSKSKRAVVQL